VSAVIVAVDVHVTPLASFAVAVNVTGFPAPTPVTEIDTGVSNSPRAGVTVRTALVLGLEEHPPARNVAIAKSSIAGTFTQP
jgi:hypothetical protein